ncbi:autotransporter assembly complex protein TamA [Tateyamaria sp. SN6-1]|uniref:autotransporter assembly complex protein TamA n=1 Tax=Tateyamaria sp. SN6-1 TaxID=3092148 RepID=UPI0039F4E385
MRRTVCATLFSLTATLTQALTTVQVDVVGGDEALTDSLRQSSALVTAQAEGRADPSDVLGAALSDYRNMVEALYAQGYYSGVVSIMLDGREVSNIALLNAPRQINTAAIRVDPGPQFRFGTVNIGPVPPNADVAQPQSGTPARSSEIRGAVVGTVDAWREAGHPKALPDGQRVVADHPNQTLDVDVSVAPGPQARLGNLILKSENAVRENRIRRIAAFPSGAVFSPDDLTRVATRLRRVGAFSAVNLSEAETLNADDTLDVNLTLVDAKPRRFGFGAEIASFEGLNLSAFWLHRNLLGGAERLRLDFEVSNIGSDTGGVDYLARSRYTVPAALGPDTSAFAIAELESLDEEDFSSDSVTLGIGASKIFSETFEAELGINIEYTETTDDLGTREFTLLTFPGRIIWDRRDDALNATSGFYVAANATPFLGLDGSSSGLRTEVDARAYRALGAGGVVLAGRLQFGSVAGPSLTDTRSDYLFFSGGGGTVRGQPFQSLNVDLGGGVEIGGRSFVGLSGEIRGDVAGNFGAVAFVDAGYIGPEAFFDGSGEWHAGAGIGLRYNTAIGPIRFDVGAPISGDTGDGAQIYIGIGQAF